MKNLKILALISLAVLPLKYVGAQTNAYQSPRYLSIYIENDQFAGRDRCFTGGLKISWMSKTVKKAEQKSWLNWIPFIKQSGPQRAISLSLGEHIYTPDDLTASDLIEDDRPYAGIIYLSLGVHSRTHNVQDFMEFTLGIVGPATGAEQIQSFIHELIGGVDPQGWQHQLKNEFVLSWVYERKWKILRRGRTEKIGFDVIPHLGGGLGNLHTYASGGIQVRWGWRLSSDFGSFLTRPGGFRNLGFREEGGRSLYLYGGVTGMVVLRNLFLDGNTIRESHMVEKYPLTADVFLGLSLRIKRIQVFLEYVYWTKRFKTETKNQILGSLNLVYSF
jgi:lipid A 3-O-deacylase